MALRLGTLLVDIGADLTGLRDAQREIDRTGTRMQKAMVKLGLAIGAAFGLESIRRAILLADTMQVLERRIIRFAGSVTKAERTMRALTDTANSAGSRIKDVATIFQRFSLIRDDIGATNTEILGLTDTLAKLGAIGGSSQTEIKNGLVQLSQGLAAGIIRAEEYNSLIENIPETVRAIGKSMSLSMGELRDEMLKGELTSIKTFKAIQDASEETERLFKALPVSIVQASQALSNELAVAIQEIDKSLGNVSTKVGEIIKGLSEIVRKSNLESQNLREVERRRVAIRNIILEQSKLDGEASPEKARALIRIINLTSKIADLEKDLLESTGKSTNQIKQKISISKKEISSLSEKFKIESDISDVRIITAAKVLELEDQADRLRDKRGRESETAKKRRIEKIASIEKEISLLTQQFELAKKISNIRTGKEGLEEDEPLEPARVFNDEQKKRIEKIKLFGETEREEILRQERENSEFVRGLKLEDSKLELELLDQIADERLRKMREINDRLFQEDREAADRAKESRQQEQSDQISSFGQTANAIGDIFANTRTEQGKNIAGIIGGVAQLATSILPILAAQAQAQAAAGPDAPTIGQKIANIATISSVFVGLISSVRGASKGGGRQRGGSVSPNLVTPINEAGIPEILQQGNKQFLLPTGTNGKITPLSASNDATMMPNITLINNGAPMQVDNVQITGNDVKIMISSQLKQFEKQQNAQLSTGRGDMSVALRQGHRLDRNLNGRN